MNKLLSCLLFFSSVFSIAQNRDFFFEIRHQPNSEYLSICEKSIKFKTKKEADKEMLRVFDSIGLKRIRKGDKKETYKVLTITKEQKKNHTIPIEILAYDFKFEGDLDKEKINETFNFESIQAKGYVDFENKLTVNEFLIDNEQSDKQAEAIKKIENREICFDFPKHTIGIGESFSFEHIVYYSIPMRGDDFYSANCTATLVKVKKDIAYFKISSKQQSENSSYDLVVRGSFKFNIEKNYASYLFLQSELHVSEAIDDLTLIEHDYTEQNKVATVLKNN
ncbi:hypothetical protein GSB9_02215 [Flavobacteriaceae bacterium GSB9]|nr:hypothetical protein GSB9_02215 [Flavobacteriaceae bacterium GSB9]